MELAEVAQARDHRRAQNSTGDKERRQICPLADRGRIREPVGRARHDLELRQQARDVGGFAIGAASAGERFEFRGFTLTHGAPR